MSETIEIPVSRSTAIGIKKRGGESAIREAIKDFERQNFMNIGGLAKRLNVSYGTARNILLSGKIGFTRIGKRRVVAESDVVSYLAKGKVRR